MPTINNNEVEAWGKIEENVYSMKRPKDKKQHSHIYSHICAHIHTKHTFKKKKNTHRNLVYMCANFL